MIKLSVLLKNAMTVRSGVKQHDDKILKKLKDRNNLLTQSPKDGDSVNENNKIIAPPIPKTQ